MGGGQPQNPPNPGGGGINETGLSGAGGSWKDFTIQVPSGSTKLTATAMSGGSATAICQPALSFLFPVTTPLRGDVESYYAGRINIGFNFDVRPGRNDTSAMGIAPR
ncbi:MAG: hypothetical protein R3B70_01530 [Polyangiaceae bacterium]